MKKRAYINIILIGFVLIASVVVFVSTTADDVVWKNKYFNLKKITDSAAFALGNGYKENQYELREDAKAAAKDIADAILNNSNLGQDASSYITYDWCFKDGDGSTADGCPISTECSLNDDCAGTVTATITNYQHDNFWYKFMGKDQFIFDHIASRADINGGDFTTDSYFLPIAINGCDKDDDEFFKVGNSFDYILDAHDRYTDDNFATFYALSEPGGGQSSFAHFKNMITDILDDKKSEFDIETDITTISNVDWEDVDNDVKQVSQSFDITTLTPTNMAVLVLDCNSTATDLKVKGLLPILLTDVYCAPNVVDVEAAMANGDDLFIEPSTLWFKTVPSCNSTSYFRLHFEVTDRMVDVEPVDNE